MPPMLSIAPATAENTTTSTRPAMSVRFAPMRLETKPVISMATPVTAM